jgi:hypothetical protein
VAKKWIFVAKKKYIIMVLCLLAMGYSLAKLALLWFCMSTAI